MKIKIIDLLIKIANDEEVPKKIKYFGEIYEYSEDMKFYYQNGFSMYRAFFTEGNCLNDEIEIIEEEKEIEKLSNKTRYYFSTTANGMTKVDRQALDEMFDNCYKTIDQLVDEINKLKKEKNMEDQ